LDTSSDKTESQIAFDVPAKISPTELRGYEEIIPPHTARPKLVNLSHDSTQKYHFIIFDTETTCTGKLAEVCHLSAVSENGRHEFSTFILAQSIISHSAYWQWYVDQEHQRSKDNPVQSVTMEEALRDFLTFITQAKTSDQHNNHVTVLIGHNSTTFDVPIFLRNSDKTSMIALLT